MQVDFLAFASRRAGECWKRESHGMMVGWRAGHVFSDLLFKRLTSPGFFSASTSEKKENSTDQFFRQKGSDIVR